MAAWFNARLTFARLARGSFSWTLDFFLESQIFAKTFCHSKQTPYFCTRKRQTVWRDGRVVDYSSLENCRAERHRGFESLSLRQRELEIAWFQVLFLFDMFFQLKISALISSLPMQTEWGRHKKGCVVILTHPRYFLLLLSHHHSKRMTVVGFPFIDVIVAPTPALMKVGSQMV